MSFDYHIKKGMLELPDPPSKEELAKYEAAVPMYNLKGKPCPENSQLIECTRCKTIMAVPLKILARWDPLTAICPECGTKLKVNK